jgi:ABC-type nitrate/sulfonate/bicarbonate transport system substrate-binding protein
MVKSLEASATARDVVRSRLTTWLMASGGPNIRTVFHSGAARLLAALIAATVGTATVNGNAQAQAPVKLTVGYGPASDFTLLFIKLRPDIAKNHGKSYTLDLQEFRGTDMRFRAYLSGALDGATGSANAIVDAASKGVGLAIVASISKESTKGFNTTYLVKEDSPIRSLKDLKGKVIGTNAHRSSIELWARLAAENGGLDRERDVRFTVVEFPVQGQAVRSGQIDVGAFPQPYLYDSRCHSV